MPQLDASTFASQLFWLGLSFFVLYLILSLIALPRIKKTMLHREEIIKEKINTASTYRERAEDLLAEYEKILSEAKEKAHERAKASTHTIMTNIENDKKIFISQLNERLHISEQELYRAKVTAAKEVKEMGGDIATTIMHKLTGQTYSLDQLLKKGKNG